MVADFRVDQLTITVTTLNFGELPGAGPYGGSGGNGGGGGGSDTEAEQAGIQPDLSFFVLTYSCFFVLKKGEKENFTKVSTHKR